MKRIQKAVFVTLSAAALCSCVSPQQRKAAEQSARAELLKISYWKARRELVAALGAAGGTKYFRMPPRDIRVGPDGFEMTVESERPDLFLPGRHSFIFRELAPARAWYHSDSGNFGADKHWLVLARGSRWAKSVSGSGRGVLMFLGWRNGGDAAAFARAVNRLALGHVGDEEDFSAFEARAAEWRRRPRPPLSEEVRRKKLLGEAAFKEKDFERALDHFEAGLQIDPLWPEGHFNAALLSAELGALEPAVSHMKKYLALVPDASDAAAARDQLLIWEDRLSR